MLGSIGLKETPLKLARSRGKISIGSIDFAAFSFALNCICCISVRSFLVRNWCDDTNDLKSDVHVPRCISSWTVAVRAHSF